ncbi:MAG: ATP phosphoribosyltransferase regulatory subunit (EC [uncultured Thiotrichaceae bacterium]|uniref:ATP phosphoribosyltransferase regulatory subunit n=1 Tax=uncultured Thiotrichaceae bacterium TaxID=298394 RepID=A0A6S6T2C4_9GAMM|nr:MAG: ATP phosphoribosyltransferase regulatory subunit (EC [uncultured Thiotrichaceae bacterium]
MSYSEMKDNQNWLLPDGIYESLPEEAQRLENLRRDLLNLYAAWGYQLVLPPIVEFMDSLSTGTGTQLDLQTFKVTDQMTGRVMGIRADITPQVARLDAHQMGKALPNRLCYAGPVLRTRSNHSNRGSRSPYQIGAELFGHAGLDSDLEVIALALASIDKCHAGDVVLDLGHVGIFSALAKALSFDAVTKANVSDMLSRKSIPELSEWVASQDLDPAYADILLKLPEFNGDISVVAEAKVAIGDSNTRMTEILDSLEQTSIRLAKRFPDVTIHVDLSELRGYAYHTGMVFEIYAAGMRREIIRGGRYDGIGAAFGNSRPATGFSTDLRILADIKNAADTDTVQEKILAPVGEDLELVQVIDALRADGCHIVKQLDGQQYLARELGCQKQLVKQDNDWVIVPV